MLVRDRMTHQPLIVVTPDTPITDSAAWLDCTIFEQRMMYLDLVTYLPDEIFVKIDRAAMGVSL